MIRSKTQKDQYNCKCLGKARSLSVIIMKQGIDIFVDHVTGIAEYFRLGDNHFFSDAAVHVHINLVHWQF